MTIFADTINAENEIYLKQSDQFINVKMEKIGFHRDGLNEILHNDVDDDKYLMGFFRTGMQIFIKTIDDKILTFEMQHSNKIRNVKIKIQEKTKLSADKQNLFFQGEILDDDDKTIDEYQICDKSVINIVAGLKGGMQIIAKTMDGKTVTFEVSKSDKMRDIKKRIQEKAGLHRDEQKLIYQGGILQDDKRIGEYEICDKSVINIVK